MQNIEQIVALDTFSARNPILRVEKNDRKLSF